MISQANSVQGGAEKMCDTLINDKFFSHLLLKFVPPVKKKTVTDCSAQC